MELVNKGQKLRDFIVFTFNVVPESVDIQVNKIVISFEREVLENAVVSLEEIQKETQKLVDRKVEIELI